MNVFGRKKDEALKCTRCGVNLKLIDKNDIKYYNGKPYCDVCFSRLSSARVICSSCGKYVRKEEIRTVDGKHVCVNCIKY